MVLVYVVMCAMFESLIYPAAILTTFVFSIFGVFWLFWITGTTYSIMASIGVLILMGVVVNNGIVMIVHINQLRHQGLLRREALIQGAKDRLRPILMTMGTAILGMVPLCISNASIGGDGPPAGRLVALMAGHPNVPLMNRSSVSLSKNSTSAACCPIRMFNALLNRVCSK